MAGETSVRRSYREGIGRPILVECDAGLARLWAEDPGQLFEAGPGERCLANRGTLVRPQADEAEQCRLTGRAHRVIDLHQGPDHQREWRLVHELTAGNLGSVRSCGHIEVLIPCCDGRNKALGICRALSHSTYTQICLSTYY